MENTNIFNDINKKINENIEKLNKATNADDLISKVSNAPIGSEEHLEISKHIDNVKEINSTKRINQTIKILHTIGWIGLILTAITELAGAIYDLDYHIPTLKNDIGVFGIGLIAMLITAIAIGMAHKMGDGLVNSKWKSTPRLILIFFMLVGVGIGIYFNYRMVTNYSKKVIEDLKTKELNSNSSISGVKNNIVDNNIKLKQDSINRLNNQLDLLNKKLENINSQKDKFNNALQRAIDIKEKTNDKKEIRKINQNIYTARKELKRLTVEEETTKKDIEDIENKINNLTNQISQIANNKVNNLKELNEEMKGEQFNRLVFLFILVIFFKIASFMGLLADFISNKNTEQEYLEKLDSIRNIADANSVISANLMQIEAQQIANMNKNLGMIRLNNETTYLSSLNNMHQQTQATRGFISATNELTSTNTELVNMAIDGAKNAIIAGIENKKRKALEEILESKLLDNKGV